MKNKRIMIHRGMHYRASLRIDDPIKLYVAYHDIRPKEQLKRDLDDITRAMYNGYKYWVGSYGCILITDSRRSEAEWGKLVLCFDKNHSSCDLCFRYHLLPCAAPDIKYSDLYVGDSMVSSLFFDYLMRVVHLDDLNIDINRTMILRLLEDSVDWVRRGEADEWFFKPYITQFPADSPKIDRNQRLVELAKEVYEANRDHLMHDYIPTIRRNDNDI